MGRERREELGLDATLELESITYGFRYVELPHERERVEKRGFSKGKAYFCSAARYIGKNNFKLQSEEIKQVRWCSYFEAIGYFRQGRREKAILLEKILGSFYL